MFERNFTLKEIFDFQESKKLALKYNLRLELEDPKIKGSQYPLKIINSDNTVICSPKTFGEAMSYLNGYARAQREHIEKSLET